MAVRRRVRDSNRLSARGVAAETLPGMHADGHGLYLRVSRAGTKSWVFRYRRDGRLRDMGLGACHTLTLAEARERARLARVSLLDGRDPIDARRADRQSGSRGMTFQEAAERYIAKHRAGWKNAVHAKQWPSTLLMYVYPAIGSSPVSTIDTHAVLSCLEPIWTEKPETASRVRGRIERVLGWAQTMGFREGDNPARWRGHLQNILPAHNKVARVKHHAALPYVEVGSFIRDLRSVGGTAARALEFTILTAARTGEVIGAGWDEIDLASGVWTIPGERMKAGKEHRVPLSDQARTILAQLPREHRNPHVFTGLRAAMSKTLKDMGRDTITVHGFRSTFRDWTAERTAYPREICEAALAHVNKDRVEAAYLRGDALAKRARLMQDWAGFCDQVSESSSVIPIKPSVSSL